MSDDDGSGSGKKPATQTMDFSNLDLSTLQPGKGHLPFAESEAPPAREGPAADGADGALPFANQDPLASTTLGQGPVAPPMPQVPSPAPPQPSRPSQPARPSQPRQSQPMQAFPVSQPGQPPPPHASQPGQSQPGPPPPHPSQPWGAPPPQAAISQPPPAAPAPQGASPWAGAASKAAVEARHVRPPVPTAAPAVPVAAPQRIESVAPGAAVASEGLAFLWAEPGSALRFRRDAEFKPLIDALEDRPVDAELDGAGSEDDDLSTDDRREIFEVLARGRATDGAGLRKAQQGSLRPDGKFVAALVLIVADLGTPFDERERLRATITTVTPFVPPMPEKSTEEGAPEPKTPPLLEAVEDAQQFFDGSDDLCAASIFDGFTSRIVEVFEEDDRELPDQYLQTATERALLQKRKYQTRLLFGGPHLRTVLHVTGCEEPVPTYLPESLAADSPDDA